MGTLFYGADRLAITLDDRLLAHLQIVITNKLRRQEPLMLNWRDNESVGNGRSSVWISVSTDLHFKYSDSRIPQINPTWIDALLRSSNSAMGLQLLDEGSLDEPPRGTST
ncbi:ATP-dependent DNA ligase [Leifsonia sp. NPDC058292]|uniref:DUF7882 family protein n=1 Tax=Leifsonia sp. NPDC058292 TaxID=3346428 RepID=UPI0036DE3C4E